MSARYRPQQARASPLWQCLHAALPGFLLHYAERHAPRLGPLLSERQAAIERFLRCGDLSKGFLRVRCEDCDHEYLVPFTCKQRGVCPTCHQRRSVDLAQTIATEICTPVPHRHWVFTLPRLLRPVFRREPRRLGLLARITADCLAQYLRDRCGLPRASPGIVLAFHTFADAFIAALCEHIPPKGFQTLRYYGYYSNKARGQRRKAEGPQPAAKPNSAHCPLPTAHSAARQRRRWRERLLDIWGCDPFRCPCCGGHMRPRGTIESAGKARAVLEPLGLWDPVIIDHVTGPRAPPASTRWAIDALDGTVLLLEWETHPRKMPNARLPRPLHLAPERNDSADCQPPTADCAKALDDQLVLIIDNPDPWAHETEPIFWTD